MANIEQGIALSRALTDLLNGICKEEGGIRRNDPRIWDDYLHKMTNEEWDDIITTLAAIEHTSPGTFYPQDLDVVTQAHEALIQSMAKDKSFVGRPLIARSGNKTLAWRTIMTMREVVNRYSGEYIPNRPGNVEDIRDLKPATNFDEIFD